MNSRSLLIVLILIILTGAIVYVYSTRSAELPSNNTTPTPVVTSSANDTPAPTNIDTISTIPTEQAPEANIRVTSPQANDTVGRQFNVAGEARVFENVFQIRITHDSSGEVVYFQYHMADALDIGQYGDFDVPVTLPVRTAGNVELEVGDALTLEVFQFSAKDGSEVDKVTIPIVY